MGAEYSQGEEWDEREVVSVRESPEDRHARHEAEWGQLEADAAAWSEPHGQTDECPTPVLEQSVGQKADGSVDWSDARASLNSIPGRELGDRVVRGQGSAANANEADPNIDIRVETPEPAREGLRSDDTDRVDEGEGSDARAESPQMVFPAGLESRDILGEELRTEDATERTLERAQKQEQNDGSAPPEADQPVSDDDQASGTSVEAARSAVASALAQGELERGRRPEVLEVAGVEQVGGDHVDTVLKVETGSGETIYFKPQDGQADGMREALPERSGAKREVAASELDGVLGLDVVPRTIMGRVESTETPLEGSVQEEVPHESRQLDNYRQIDVDRMAVLDYVIATSDRHSGNYRTSSDGRPFAIDNSYSFPESDADPIRSDFVASRLGRPLDESVVTAVRGVDDFHVERVLEGCGIGPAARAGVLDRIHEIQREGSITGLAWPGEIRHGDLRIAREALRR